MKKAAGCSLFRQRLSRSQNESQEIILNHPVAQTGDPPGACLPQEVDSLSRLAKPAQKVSQG